VEVECNEAKGSVPIASLLLPKGVMTHQERNAVSDVICEVNYAYGTNLSVVVVEVLAWDSGVYSLVPLYFEVQRDGVVV